MDPVRNSNRDFNAPQPADAPLDPALDAAAKEKYARRFQRGVQWMKAGACTLVLSFGVNFLLFQSGSDLSIPMYVLTSAGALCCLKGMMDIF